MTTLAPVVAALWGLGTPELILIMGMMLLFFGADRLPGLAGSLGKSIREFKKHASDVEDSFRTAIDEGQQKKLPTPAPGSTTQASQPSHVESSTPKQG